MNIDFIGLGHMGAAMAANLLKAGHTLTVYNRTAEKADALVAQGALRAATPADAMTGDVVITMLADDAAVEAISDDLFAMAPDSVHMSCSTISVALADKLAESHAAAGHGFVSAPVFGRPEAAAAARLFIVAAGQADTIARVQPLFDAMGQRTFIVGDTPSAANLIKLSGNFLIASVIESLGEAMALVAKGGIDRAQYLDILTSTLFDAPAYRTYGGLIASGKFEPAGFAVPLGLKDMRLVGEAAQGLHVPMPVASVIRDRLTRLVATGGEGLDWSAIGGLAAQDAGLD